MARCDAGANVPKPLTWLNTPSSIFVDEKQNRPARRTARSPSDGVRTGSPIIAPRICSAPRSVIAATSWRAPVRLMRRRPGEDFHRAELAEAELRADRRGRVAIGLDHRGLAPVGTRVGETAPHERAVDAFPASFRQRRGATKQHDGRVR